MTIQKKKAQNKENRRLLRARKSQIVWDFLKLNPCYVCGESDPVVLEFNHLDPSEKIDNVSTIAGSDQPVDVLIREMEKCEVLCSNCHKRLTAKQQGWYKDIIR